MNKHAHHGNNRMNTIFFGFSVNVAQWLTALLCSSSPTTTIINDTSHTLSHDVCGQASQWAHPSVIDHIDICSNAETTPHRCPHCCNGVKTRPWWRSGRTGVMMTRHLPALRNLHRTTDPCTQLKCLNVNCSLRHAACVWQVVAKPGSEEELTSTYATHRSPDSETGLWAIKLCIEATKWRITYRQRQRRRPSLKCWIWRPSTRHRCSERHTLSMKAISPDKSQSTSDYTAHTGQTDNTNCRYTLILIPTTEYTMQSIALVHLLVCFHHAVNRSGWNSWVRAWTSPWSLYCCF